ncbi:MAG: Lrp/AsnC family transcriptional regulator [Pseudomonadota bacterium]
MPRARDAIDRELLALLSTNARMSTSEIARRLDVARSTVNERIVRLEQSGVIAGYRAIIAPDSGTMQTRAFLHLQIDRTKNRAILQTLQRYPEIQECMTVSGPHALLCTVKAPCAEDIDALIDDVIALDGVCQATATVVLASKFDRSTPRPISMQSHLTMAS